MLLQGYCCRDCGLAALLIPPTALTPLPPPAIGWCAACERLLQAPACHRHPQQALTPWRPGQPCPRCGGQLLPDPDALQV